MKVIGQRSYPMPESKANHVSLMLSVVLGLRSLNISSSPPSSASLAHDHVCWPGTRIRSRMRPFGSLCLSFSSGCPWCMRRDVPGELSPALGKNGMPGDLNAQAGALKLNPCKPIHLRAETRLDNIMNVHRSTQISMSSETYGPKWHRRH